LRAVFFKNVILENFYSDDLIGFSKQLKQTEQFSFSEKKLGVDGFDGFDCFLSQFFYV